MNVNPCRPLSTIQGDVVFQDSVPQADTQEVKPMRGDRRAHGAQRIRRDRWNRRGDDSGSTLVEAAFVMPIFMVLIFGIFEFSGLVMTKTGAGSAVNGGVRMAVVQGDGTGSTVGADYWILRSIERDGGGLSQDQIMQIVIWNATGPGDPVPGACTGLYSPTTYFTGITKTSTVGGEAGQDGKHACNVYNSPQTPKLGAFAKAALPVAGPTDPVSDAFADWWFDCMGYPPAGTDLNRYDCHWAAHYRQSGQAAPNIASTSRFIGVDTDYIGIYIAVKHTFYTGLFGKAAVIKASSVGKIEPQKYLN